MPGNERSGRKGLGSALLADSVYDCLRQGADLFRELCPGGVGPKVEAWIECAHAVAMQAELHAAKQALARSLLEGDDVTDACLRLMRQHADRYGPILRIAGAA